MKALRTQNFLNHFSPSLHIFTPQARLDNKHSQLKKENLNKIKRIPDTEFCKKFLIIQTLQIRLAPRMSLVCFAKGKTHQGKG